MTIPTSIEPSTADMYPVVAADTFILATRETGYRSAAAAVAELIDNSLQANASQIDIVVRAEDHGGGIGIAVLDNGGGMDPQSLRRALQFGGSERFDSRIGFGRFGMGLPNSSLSQARRVEVYSWQDGENPHFSYLDVDDIANKRCDTVPPPIIAALPKWAEARRARSGTLVVWPTCDRLGLRRVSTVSARLRAELGRIYRYALWQGVQITVNSDNVDALDPLLCRGRVHAPGAEPVGEPLKYEIRTPTNPATASVVTVRFSILPVAAWAPRPNPEKRRLGVTGRAGVSIVRAGREIDYGWYLMGEKRKENYDDWWRCEIAFQPDLDEYFRVTHSKQGVTPHPKLAEMIAPDLEHMARMLNVRVRGEFRSLSTGLEKAHGRVSSARGEPGGVPVSRLTAATSATRRERHLPPLRRTVKRYVLRIAAASTGRFFSVDVVGESAVVTINSNHPFYEAVYAPACANGRNERFGVECIILSAARAELAERDARRSTDAHAEAWGDALAAFLKSS